MKKLNRKVSDEEIIFLKKLGCSTPKMAEMKKISYVHLSIRIKKLAEEGYIEPAQRGWEAASRARCQRKKAEVFKRLIESLESNNGVMSLSEVTKTVPGNILREVIAENRERFQLIDLRWGGTLPASRLIRVEYLGKKFLTLKAHRTGIVRFFMKVFKERMYGQYESTAVSRWLKDFGLARAERVAIISKLGYRFSVKGGCAHLRHLKIDGYLDHKPMILRRKPVNTQGP